MQRAFDFFGVADRANDGKYRRFLAAARNGFVLPRRQSGEHRADAPAWKRVSHANAM
jgi:hypothetical protein